MKKNLTKSAYYENQIWLLIWVVLMSAVSFNLFAVGEDTGMNSNILDSAIFTNDFYPILAWDPQHGWRQEIDQRKNGLASIQDCNFNLGGFVLPRDLPECEELGLKVIMAPDVPDILVWMREWKHLSDEEIDARVKTMVDSAGDSPAVAGYFLTDEPGATCFPALGKAVNAVRKYAPGKLAYINLFPGYATIGAPDQSQLETESFTEYLERFVEDVKPQFISYDNYMVQYSNDLVIKERIPVYFNDLIEVRRVAMKHGLPFWNIVSSNQIRPFTTIPSPANLRFQAYTTLAAGYRGLTWFTYYARGYGYAPIGTDGEKNITWTYLQAVNHEVKALGPIMNKLDSTGLYFTSPAIAPNLPEGPGIIIETVESDVPLMVGEFKHEDGSAYAMIVNLSLEKSAKLIPMRDGEAVEGVYFSPHDGRPLPINYDHGLWVVAGQGVLIRPEAE